MKLKLKLKMKPALLHKGPQLTLVLLNCIYVLVVASVRALFPKCFQKLVFNQLYQYMKENGLFTSDQSGFLRLHSTLTCLLKMSDDWYNGLDLGKLVGLVFIDLKRHLILSTKIFSVKGSNFMAFSRESFLRLSLTYLTAKNSVGLTVLIQISGK